MSFGTRVSKRGLFGITIGPGCLVNSPHHSALCWRLSQWLNAICFAPRLHDSEVLLYGGESWSLKIQSMRWMRTWWSFAHNWPFAGIIHQRAVMWRLDVFFVVAWTGCWTKNRVNDNLGRYYAHMTSSKCIWPITDSVCRTYALRLGHLLCQLQFSNSFHLQIPLYEHILRVIDAWRWVVVMVAVVVVTGGRIGGWGWDGEEGLGMRCSGWLVEFYNVKADQMMVTRTKIYTVRYSYQQIHYNGLPN